MKNADLPLMQALKGRAKPKGNTTFDKFEPPRTFEIHHHEIPGLPGKRVGEHISVNLKGQVHSQHEGKTVVHINDIKPDSSEMTKESYPDKKTPSHSGAIVTTQESHNP